MKLRVTFEFDSKLDPESLRLALLQVATESEGIHHRLRENGGEIKGTRFDVDIKLEYA